MTAYRERKLRQWAIDTLITLPELLGDSARLTRRLAALDRARGLRGPPNASPESLASVQALYVQLRFAVFCLTTQSRTTPNGDHVRLLLEELGGSRPNEILLRNERAAQQRRAILRGEHPSGVSDA